MSTPPDSPGRCCALSALASRALGSLLGIGLLGLVMLFTLGPASAFRQAAKEDKKDKKDKAPPAKKPGEPPVILLTGFEPFSASGPTNPSWEAIKGLDGKKWKGHVLVCKQAKVVWGSPLKQFDEWITKHRPVAVFSFGQGGPGSFALESLAHNARGDGKDNDGKKPAAELIVKDGPKQYRARLPLRDLAGALAEKGHPVRISTNAGRYLCEEALYSLEHLRATKRPTMPVLFCHVPAPRARKGDKAKYEPITRFVTDLLDAWHEQTHPRDARHQEVREMIVRYFRTWSAQDMKGYDACFHPDACVQHIDANGTVSTSNRADFIESQRQYHKEAKHKATEVPETIDIRFEQGIARVVVYWKLTAGPERARGYDHFTLRKDSKGWRILNLVFYEVK